MHGSQATDGDEVIDYEFGLEVIDYEFGLEATVCRGRSGSLAILASALIPAAETRYSRDLITELSCKSVA